METQILNLQPPFDYIHCNSEVGKHIATMIVYETTRGEDGSYKLETHSHPIIKYYNAPSGVVWDKAELTDCDVICNESNMKVITLNFIRMIRKKWGVRGDTNYIKKAKYLREVLLRYDIVISDDDFLNQYKGRQISSWGFEVALEFKEENGIIICHDNGKSHYPIYCEAKNRDDLLEQLEDQCYEWERFTDRRVKITFVTDQEDYKKVIDDLEFDRMTWDEE